MVEEIDVRRQVQRSKLSSCPTRWARKHKIANRLRYCPPPGRGRRVTRELSCCAVRWLVHFHKVGSNFLSKHVGCPHEELRLLVQNPDSVIVVVVSSLALCCNAVVEPVVVECIQSLDVVPNSFFFGRRDVIRSIVSNAFVKKIGRTV